MIDYSTIDSGINMSDHIPVTCTIAFPKQAFVGNIQRSNNNQGDCTYSLRWDKGDLAGYYDSTGALLQVISTPFE